METKSFESIQKRVVALVWGVYTYNPEIRKASKSNTSKIPTRASQQKKCLPQKLALKADASKPMVSFPLMPHISDMSSKRPSAHDPSTTCHKDQGWKVSWGTDWDLENPIWITFYKTKNRDFPTQSENLQPAKTSVLLFGG